MRGRKYQVFVETLFDPALREAWWQFRARKLDLTQETDSAIPGLNSSKSAAYEDTL